MFSKLMQLADGVFGDIESKARKSAGARSKERDAAVTAMVAYLPDGDADLGEGEPGQDPFSDAEKDVVRRVCHKLGEDPQVYGL